MAKKYLSVTVVSIFVVVLFSQIAFADIWGGNKYWNGITIVEYDDSVANYGYTEHYDEAMENWRNISSQVTLQKASHQYADRYYVGNTDDATLLGVVIPYTISGKKLGYESNWSAGYATAIIYDNTMNSYNMTYAQKVSNATHELGHTLKLAHPSSTQVSVMNQGIQSIGPTTYDKNELKRKWGN
ncbi:hypothetical protein [Paenibacillus sp. 32O-W]|uniref:hypothetical protein n=1 Tax=Paenibacillus sp. 32O-W TaxID=1695218 RepID=UPI0011A77E13|nr:hypothetical protein [Paenibacillus sp. 32O-W]